MTDTAAPAPAAERGLSWSNFSSRITHRHPGRVWCVFLGIALTPMERNMFALLGTLLGFHSTVGIAWIAAVATDLVINKRLGLGPPSIEFERAYPHAVNPAGFGAILIASSVSTLAPFGLFGTCAGAVSTFIAAGLALLLCSLIAWMTRGTCDLARPNAVGGTSRAEGFGGGPDAAVADTTATHACAACETAYGPPDTADCPVHAGTGPLARLLPPRDLRGRLPQGAAGPCGAPAPRPPCARLNRRARPTRTHGRMRTPERYLFVKNRIRCVRVGRRLGHMRNAVSRAGTSAEGETR
ncbi:hypothetical protein [Streptomyces sp. NPDC058701]|uniref:hypothetical protein n=1 Tax=Streptomyces sp. NPDC058701 TaxID=3346608 RepID=UPI003660B37B